MTAGKRAYKAVPGKRAVKAAISSAAVVSEPRPKRLQSLESGTRRSKAPVKHQSVKKKNVASRTKAGRYILLPADGMQATAVGNPEIARFLSELSQGIGNVGGIKLASRSLETRAPISIQVLDSIRDDGAKLVSIDDDHLAAFRLSYPGLTIVPEVFYELDFQRKVIRAGSGSVRGKRKAPIKSSFQFVDQKGNGLKAVRVVAYTDFEAGIGDEGITNSKGLVTLKLKSLRIERLYVYPEHSYWGHFEQKIAFKGVRRIILSPIDPAYVDGLRYFYPTRVWGPLDLPIRIGIIDTGCSEHKDLPVLEGINLVLGEDNRDYDDYHGHGTHVAGIIGAHRGIPGVAAGAELYIYKVFGRGRSTASNYDIMKAIDRAIVDECDFINMSLGGSTPDVGVARAIRDAYSKGVVCFAASGNDSRKPVNFPALESLVMAVSAMGRKGCFPPRSVNAASVAKPFGTDPNNFIADFSNIGKEIALTAPGVGIISTYPTDNYSVMDGTSMACPAAVGLAARLLSAEPAIYAMPRDQARADAIKKYLAGKIVSLGFGANFEGNGMLML